MNLVPVSLDSIRIGQPLPFPLVDQNGVLLARKFFVVESRAQLQDIAERGRGIFIDTADSEALHRAYVDQLQTLVRTDMPLGQIADSKLSAESARKRVADTTDKVDWLDLQEQTNFLLRDTNPVTFQERLSRIEQTLKTAVRRNPDGALFALIHLSATEMRMYSATHAMLVSVMCCLAAREVLAWPEAMESALCRAALTMNVSMTELHDKLAHQIEPPTQAQRTVIDQHAQASVVRLRALGVGDHTWLDAVRDHHTPLPGPLAARTEAQRVARLVQRADMFAARLAPRASRTPIAPAAAMQACYFDENRQVDEAGAALIKAAGIYQPGSYVRLATEEIAVVVKRGMNTSTPRVAVLINRSGMPTVEPTIRDTSQRDYRVVASVAHREVKVTLHMERMLALTVSPASDRPW